MSTQAISERTLLGRLRACLFAAFGEDAQVSEGSATKYGAQVAYRSEERNLAQSLRSALAIAIPPGRTLEIRSYRDPLHDCRCYLIHVLPPERAAVVGGPRELQAEAVRP